MDFQLVVIVKAGRTLLANELLIRVEGTDVLAYHTVLLEGFLAVRTGIHVVLAMNWDVQLQLKDVIEVFLTDGALELLATLVVGTHVASQG